MHDLRPYQAAFLDAARARLLAGARRILCVAPTGAGKTVMAAHIVARSVSLGKRVLFLAHRHELIDQASAKLDDSRIDHGVIKSGHWRQLPHLPVQVASVQTLSRRSVMPPADLVITDEAHHVSAASYTSILSHYPDAIHLGLTATPYRADGRGLGEFYDELLPVADITTLIELGFLVHPVTYAPASPDLAGVSTLAGDYNRGQLAARMDRPQLVGDLVSTWIRYASGRTTVAFGVSVEHSEHIAREFSAAGVPAAHLDGETPEDLRSEILAQLSSGSLQLVSNVGILTEGWDLPRTSCVILARPTQSKGLYFQMVGRGLRSSPGKRDCIVLDHAACSLAHGLVTEPQTHSLAGRPRRRSSDEPTVSVRTCPRCFLTMAALAQSCASCQYVFPVRPRELPQQVDGELVEVRRGPYTPTEDDGKKTKKLRELIDLGQERGYAPGWAPMRFKLLYGHWPKPATLNEMSSFDMN